MTRTRTTDELEVALRRAEARLEGIVEIAADAVISVNAEQRIVYFNSGAERIFGWTSSEILGESLELLIPPTSRGLHRQHVSGFGAGEERARRMGHERSISGIRRDGEEFPAEASISKHTVDGETLYHVVLRDVTHQRRAELQQRFLADAGELLTSSLDVSETLERAARAAVSPLADVCVIWLLDENARELRAEAAHGIHASEGTPTLLERLRETPIPMHSAHAAVVVAEARGSVRFVVGSDASAVHELGVAFTLQCAATGDDAPPLGAPEARPVHGLLVSISAAGETNGVLALYREARAFGDDGVRIAEDFARRLALAVDNARLYERAQRAIKTRDDTMAVVSHDLRNPVNAIRMLAGVLLARSEDPSTLLRGAREELATIVSGAEQADGLIQDLLDAARIEAGGLRVNLEPLDLLALLNESAGVLRPLAADRDIAFELDLPASLPLLEGDAERIRQVISNLVGNALKFTPRGGRVTLGACVHDGEVQVRVEDTGEGVAPELVPRIFDRYWQGDPRTRRGAGLGLTIARGIVQAHGGRIRVESTPGVGSVFWFSLPA